MKKRILCLLLSLLLLWPAMPICAESRTAPPLRVLLRRLGLTDHARITPEGACLLEGKNGTELLMKSGEAFTLRLRDGQIVLFHTAFTAPLGSSVTLTRQQSGDSAASGLYICSAGLYPGDLSLTISEDRLQPVLTLDMEDYLCGVVPYEMSDSFPLEALKAQAVCARTYALNRVSRDRSWDVVDTTNDQVFRGVSDANENAARAVSETAGQVLTRGGKLVECYYSASNGGQTEIPSHVWGTAPTAGKYEIRDDEWDRENPSSLIRSASLPKDGSVLYRRIARLLREAVTRDDAWKKTGLSGDESTFRIDRISAVAAKTPKYDAPSRLMTELDVTLDVSGRKLNGGTLGPYESAGSYTVTLNIFPDVLDALGLAINGSGNELLTVTEDEESFRLTTSRFGHGVGLSQRGAQYMASEGEKTYKEILSFYFPESALETYARQPSVLSTVNPLLADPTPAATPAPSSAPAPTLMPVTEENLPAGAWIASVEGISDGSTLNLRSAPSPIASIVMTLRKHQKLIVLDDLDVPGWAKVRTDTVEGYVMTSFLEKAP